MGHAGAAPHRVPRVYGDPPQGHPSPAWDDLIAAFRDHGTLTNDTWQEVQQKTPSRGYLRRVRARLLEIPDPLRQRWDDVWLRRLGPCSPPSHLRQTCHLCGECDTVSSAAPTGPNRCAQCSQLAAWPWPEPPMGPHRRTEEEALHRRIGGAHAPSHEHAGPSGATILWIQVHLRDRPSRTCRRCLRPDAHSPPHLAEPAAACLEDKGTGRGTPEPAAERKRRLSGA